MNTVGITDLDGSIVFGERSADDVVRSLMPVKGIEEGFCDLSEFQDLFSAGQVVDIDTAESGAPLPSNLKNFKAQQQGM